MNSSQTLKIHKSTSIPSNIIFFRIELTYRGAQQVVVRKHAAELFIIKLDKVWKVLSGRKVYRRKSYFRSHNYFSSPSSSSVLKLLLDNFVFHLCIDYLNNVDYFTHYKPAITHRLCRHFIQNFFTIYIIFSLYTTLP